VKMFDADKTRIIGLKYGEKNYDNTLSRFHLIPERHGQTDRQTDGWTELLCQYRASVCCTRYERRSRGCCVLVLNTVVSVSPSVEAWTYCMRHELTDRVLLLSRRRRATDAVRLTVVSVSLITDTFRGISGTTADNVYTQVFTFYNNNDNNHDNNLVYGVNDSDLLPTSVHSKPIRWRPQEFLCKATKSNPPFLVHSSLPPLFRSSVFISPSPPRREAPPLKSSYGVSLGSTISYPARSEAAPAAMHLDTF